VLTHAIINSLHVAGNINAAVRNLYKSVVVWSCRLAQSRFLLLTTEVSSRQQEGPDCACERTAQTRLMHRRTLAATLLTISTHL